MRIAQLQLSVQEETEKNLDGLERMMEQAASEKPDLVAAGSVPRCFIVSAVQNEQKHRRPFIKNTRAERLPNTQDADIVFLK